MPKNSFQDDLREMREGGNMVWDKFTQEVKPLNRKPTQDQFSSTEYESFEMLLESETVITTNTASTKTEFTVHQRRPKSGSNVPTTDAKFSKMVKRGQIIYEEKCDLHGCTEDQARQQLLRFVKNAQNDGKKLVLVITGIGKNSQKSLQPGKPGLLKQRVPDWLSSETFRPFVISPGREAHPKHGGAGALYVRIRKKGKVI